MTARGGFALPAVGGFEVGGDAATGGVGDTEVELGLGETCLGGAAHPLDGGGIVAGSAATGGEHVTGIKGGQDVAQFSGFLVKGEGAGEVCDGAASLLVSDGEVKRAVGAVGLGGAGKEAERHGLVARDSIALGVGEAELVKSGGVALFGFRLECGDVGGGEGGQRREGDADGEEGGGPLGAAGWG